ncbi:thiopurine S-methyltransferase [Gluconacetobacter entanii]|uniref:Thiopurine S-methyltransferase n=1 Tax=Gluconacetobacter entanii TaxID=108528 RepID=A0ABT3K3P0_9PROT|nr:thiopurine S-methyltransferase [Gluconacetobacter entanii]MCW4590027.1 thiopurine S-methyltransferase [Gluconacetobacter entanii]MCW4593897.1 thiopurine S-methyltransferase [Gluconacetobacter entanii]
MKEHPVNDAFWHAKWQRNEIGFHEPRPNAFLLRHFAQMHFPAGARIFVPLCGKSLDIHWLLAQGFQVGGIELSPIAVERLFAELGLSPRITTLGALQRFDAGNLCIFVGNFFDLTRQDLGHVDGVYDRAALIALPAAVRQRYARHLVSITNAAPELLICLDYDQPCRPGPPFSVGEAEVRQHYEEQFTLTCLERRDVPGGLKGACPATETVWKLVPRDADPLPHSPGA